MANTNTVIILKRSNTPGNVPSTLAHGELAINYADGLLYYKNNANAIVAISTGGGGGTTDTIARNLANNAANSAANANVTGQTAIVLAVAANTLAQIAFVLATSANNNAANANLTGQAAFTLAVTANSNAANANVTGQSAFTLATTANTNAAAANVTGQTGISLAVAGNTYAQTVFTLANTANNNAANANVVAQSAITLAVAGNTYAQTVFTLANTANNNAANANTLATSANSLANVANVRAAAANVTGQTGISLAVAGNTYAQSVFTMANAINVYAQTVFTLANTANNNAANANVTGQTAATIAIAGNTYAQTVFTLANTANNNAANANATGQSAFTLANTANNNAANAALLPVFVAGSLIGSRRNLNFAVANTSNLVITGTDNTSPGNVTVTFDTRNPPGAGGGSGITAIIANANTMIGTINLVAGEAATVSNGTLVGNVIFSAQPANATGQVAISLAIAGNAYAQTVFTLANTANNNAANANVTGQSAFTLATTANTNAAAANVTGQTGISLAIAGNAYAQTVFTLANTANNNAANANVVAQTAISLAIAGNSYAQTVFTLANTANNNAANANVTGQSAFTLATTANTNAAAANVTGQTGISLAIAGNIYAQSVFTVANAAMKQVFVENTLVGARQNINLRSANTSNIVLVGIDNAAPGNVTVTFDTRSPPGVLTIVANANSMTGLINVVAGEAVVVANGLGNVIISALPANQTGQVAATLAIAGNTYAQTVFTLANTANNNAANANVTGQSAFTLATTANTNAAAANVTGQTGIALAIAGNTYAQSVFTIANAALKQVFVNGTLVGARQNINLVSANTSNLLMVGIDNAAPGNVTVTFDTRNPPGAGGGGVAALIANANSMTGTINLISDATTTVLNTAPGNVTISALPANQTGQVAISLAIAGNTYAQTVFTLANTANNNAANANVTGQVAFTLATTANTNAAAANVTGQTGISLAIAGNTYAQTVFTLANTANNNAANANVTGQSAFTLATTANTNAAAANVTGQTGISLAIAGNTFAQTAFGQAQNLVAIYSGDVLIHANANINFQNTLSANIAVTANAAAKRANISITINTASNAGVTGLTTLDPGIISSVSNANAATAFAANIASQNPVYVNATFIGAQRNINFVAANTSNILMTGISNTANGNVTVTIDTRNPPGVGGSGSPGAPDTSIQYNNGGAFAGDGNLTWDAANNQFELGKGGAINCNFVMQSATDHRSIALVPTSNGRISIFAENVAGYPIIGTQRHVADKPNNSIGGADLIQDAIQSHMAFKSILWTLPTDSGGGATFAAQFSNMGWLPNTSATAIVTTAKSNTAPILRNISKKIILGATNTNNTAACVFANTNTFWCGGNGGSAGNGGGFLFSTTISVIAAGTNQRSFAGLRSGTGFPANAGAFMDFIANTTEGVIGLASNVNTGNWKFVYGAAGAGRNVIDLGVNFNYNTNDVLEITIYYKAGGANVGYRVHNLSNGAFTQNTIAANLPTANSFLQPYIGLLNNATTQSNIAIMRIYGETDF